MVADIQITNGEEIKFQELDSKKVEDEGLSDDDH